MGRAAGSISTRPSGGIVDDVPPHAYFLVSAVFHYLGPAFAVLLFAQIAPLGVAWLRIASAAVVFAAWRRPWHEVIRWPQSQQRALLAFGFVLGLMNACFYLAIARLPLGTVGAIEFLGTVGLAAAGARTWRNVGALVMAVAGVGFLVDVQLAAEPIGLVFAFANCVLFVLYVVLGHGIAQAEGGGIDRLAAAMLVALAVIFPLGMPEALLALVQPALLLAGVGVGICSSVIPYVCDQLAMARLPRSSFALLLALLPASAAVIGAVVLRQIPTAQEIIGVTLVVLAVAAHQPTADVLPMEPEAAAEGLGVYVAPLTTAINVEEPGHGVSHRNRA